VGVTLTFRPRSSSTRTCPRSHKLDRKLQNMLTLASLAFAALSGTSRRAALSTFAAAASLQRQPAFANSDSTLSAISVQTPAPAESIAGMPAGDFTALPSGVRIKDIRPGAGEPAKRGDTVAVQFSGRCLNLNGKKFISTQDAAALASGLAISEPYVFTIGNSQTIPGLEEAVTGMTKGGYRRAVVPQALGYDVAMTLGPQPDNFQDLRSLEAIVKNPNRDASLLFDVQLERVVKRS